ncbi:MAG TPA: RHS repeat-associated core domain-containing protein [Chloroflexota bacterium]|nr:RHS repeat-associated core domain-containing protein [Chloroflexota bacterium]
MKYAGYSLTPGTDSYAYDPLGRLTSDTQSGSGASTTSQTYNPNSAMASMTTPSGAGSYSYDSSGDGQLTGISAPNTQYYAYDSDGNRTCESVTTGSCTGDPNAVTYGYDEENRLTSVTQSGKTPESLGYNGDGLLSSITTGSTDSFTWNTAGSGVPSLAADYSTFTNGHTDYIDGPDGLPLEQVYVPASGGSTASFYYHDRSGDTRALLDTTSAHNVVQTYNYTPWGQVSSPTSGWSTPLLYGGQYTDQTLTGFVYMQARWYDPSSQQFTSQDPLVQATVQPYAYAGDDPINALDPYGLACSSLPFAWGGCISSAVSAWQQGVDEVGSVAGAAAQRIGATLTSAPPTNPCLWPPSAPTHAASLGSRPTHVALTARTGLRSRRASALLLARLSQTARRSRPGPRPQGRATQYQRTTLQSRREVRDGFSDRRAPRAKQTPIASWSRPTGTLMAT